MFTDRTNNGDLSMRETLCVRRTGSCLVGRHSGEKVRSVYNRRIRTLSRFGVRL